MHLKFYIFNGALIGYEMDRTIKNSVVNEIQYSILYTFAT